MKKFIPILCLFLLVSCGTKRADLRLEEYVYDFGEIPAGEIFEGSTVIRNTGGSDLVIRTVGAGCGCTRAGTYKTVVPPNDTTLLTFTYNTTGKRGLQNEYVVITANTDSLVHLMAIQASVRVPVENR